jgi:DNA-binding transcriptional MerR regulator
MNGDALYTIGDLARRTGLSVKTIRFYSDAGIVPPTDRSSAGYRLYDIDAVARLDLVRTLRELGLDLTTIRRVVDREATVPEVAAAHADALDVQIRTLRLRRAVLLAVAKRGSTTEEMDLMHKLAKLSDDERRRIISDFIDASFGGLDVDPKFLAFLRASLPFLPDDPEPDQVEAWVELGELTQDPDFRASVRRMAEYQAEERSRGDDPSDVYHGVTETVSVKVGAALEAGIVPDSVEASRVVAELTACYAEAFHRPDDAELRRWLVRRLEIAGDPRVGRYWELLAVINGWSAPPYWPPIFEWFISALRAGAAV